MLNFCDFIQVYVFTTNHHLKWTIVGLLYLSSPVFFYQLIKFEFIEFGRNDSK